MSATVGCYILGTVTIHYGSITSHRSYIFVLAAAGVYFNEYAFIIITEIVLTSKISLLVKAENLLEIIIFVYNYVERTLIVHEKLPFEGRSGPLSRMKISSSSGQLFWFKCSVEFLLL